MAIPCILAIVNRKGGTGKTTTAVNLAAELAATGERTLLIDLDTQGHCALGVGIKCAAGQATAHHLFQTPGIPPRDLIVQTAWAGLDLIPANVDFQHDAMPSDDEILARALADPVIAHTYRWIVLDSPPSLDRLLLNALAVAHWALIPCVPHPLAGEGVRQLARVFFRVAMSRNADLRLLGLLPVMLDTRIGQHRHTRQQLVGQFGQDRLLAGIRSDIKLAEAFTAGQPIRVYAPRSRGNADYQAAHAAIRTRLLA